jgi:dipeptidyl aminopeptidase/acylaminoacyl peptidase
MIVWLTGKVHHFIMPRIKRSLLICHGMVDVNVHYQDAVNITQRWSN